MSRTWNFISLMFIYFIIFSHAWIDAYPDLKSLDQIVCSFCGSLKSAIFTLLFSQITSAALLDRLRSLGTDGWNISSFVTLIFEHWNHDSSYLRLELRNVIGYLTHAVPVSIYTVAVLFLLWQNYCVLYSLICIFDGIFCTFVNFTIHKPKLWKILSY